MAAPSPSLDVPTPSVVSPTPPPLPRPVRPQVFVNFRGDELRAGFVSHLVKALKVAGVNVFTDSDEMRGRDLTDLFKRIENSEMAIVIFSDRYSQSKWCLNELEKIEERVKEKELIVIPVFYKIRTDDVKNFKGSFGSSFQTLVEDVNEGKAKRWRSSVMSVTSKTGFTSKTYSSESDLVDAIVEEMKKQLPQIPKETKITQEEIKMSSQQEIIFSLILAASIAILSNFIKPSFDLSFSKTAQWFTGVLILIFVRYLTVTRD